jgi:hypothetical protein
MLTSDRALTAARSELRDYRGSPGGGIAADFLAAS